MLAAIILEEVDRCETDALKVGRHCLYAFIHVSVKVIKIKFMLYFV